MLEVRNLIKEVGKDKTCNNNFQGHLPWFKSSITNTNKRHLLKTFSWRAMGTLDTIIIGWLITGNPLTALKIGGTEVFSKMLLYFGHEKLWYKINYGLTLRNKGKRLKNLCEEINK